MADMVNACFVNTDIFVGSDLMGNWWLVVGG